MINRIDLLFILRHEILRFAEHGQCYAELEELQWYSFLKFLLEGVGLVCCSCVGEEKNCRGYKRSQRLFLKLSLFMM